MANMIDIRPSFHGEAKVWDSLKSYLPENVVVYNNREINGREFDYCLFWEDLGVLIIEVKGWLSNKIQVQGVDQIVVEGYEKPQRSPKKQARAYRFALLNKLSKKFNVSPLVVDMVCYPFISKEEYHSSHLDIVSEEQFTIFKEDLEDQQLLLKKIELAYGACNIIPHADFSSSLMLKLRRNWEPELPADNQVSASQEKQYSILSIYPMKMQNKDLECITSGYFGGIKEIVFLKDEDDYSNLIQKLNSEFQARNIQPSGTVLELGYSTGLKNHGSSIRAFNLEIYLVKDLETISKDPIRIMEGIVGQEANHILEELGKRTQFNKYQYDVEHAPTENNTLVEAGAGTGKTYSMVSRIAFLCNKKLSPVTNIAEEIAMVTFTNDAAINMKSRLKQMFLNYFLLTGNPEYLTFVEDVDRAHISTIHSFALDILRNEVLYTGLGTNFRISSNEYLRSKIYDEYLSAFFEEMESENENFINEIPVPVYDLKKKILGVADRLLAKSIDLRKIKAAEMGVTVDNTLPYFNRIIEKVIIPAEEKYSNDTHVFNEMDLKECIIILNDVLQKIPGKIEGLTLRYLFIDEFQDTDDMQIHMFQELQKAMSTDCRMFVVGDLKQSIYRFRGAKLSAFEQLMSGSKYKWSTYSLTINYRTDHRLLELYDLVFSRMGNNDYLPYKAKDRLRSDVETDCTEEEIFVSVPCHAKDEEKFFESFLNVLKHQCEILQSNMQERESLQKKALSREERTIAVLVRSNWQVEKIVSAAKKKGVKIDTKSGGDLFQLDSTVDLYKLVTALNNSANPVYLINLIESNYINLKLDYQQYHASTEKECVEDLQRILDEFFMRQMGKSWKTIINEAYTQPILHVLKQLYDSLQPWKKYSYQYKEQKFYMANYEYLLERIIHYSRVDNLTLNQIAEYLKINITTGQQQLSREVESEDTDIQILCTTIHKSKGLEYGTVILPYTDEDISDMRKVKLDANYAKAALSYTVQFENTIREHNSNYNDSTEANEQIAEESRILYVALTRAIRNCVWMNNLDRTPSISWGTQMEG